jgi:hypothetical protein
VFADADLDAAVLGGSMAVFANSARRSDRAGPRCTDTSTATRDIPTDAISQLDKLEPRHDHQSASPQ